MFYSKSKQKLLHKVAEERELNMNEMIYLYLISQKIPIYGGSKNWILKRDSDTKKVFLHEGKIIFD